MLYIDVREYRSGKQKWTIQRKLQHRADKTNTTKPKYNTLCVGHQYTEKNTNNVSKTWALLQTTGVRDEPDIILWGNCNGHHNRKQMSNMDPTKKLGVNSSVRARGSLDIVQHVLYVLSLFTSWGINNLIWNCLIKSKFESWLDIYHNSISDYNRQDY